MRLIFKILEKEVRTQARWLSAAKVLGLRRRTSQFKAGWGGQKQRPASADDAVTAITTDNNDSSVSIITGKCSAQSETDED